MILKEEIPIKYAAQRVNINYSTAKYIYKLYTQKGIIETEHMRRRSAAISNSKSNLSKDMNLLKKNLKP